MLTTPFLTTITAELGEQVTSQITGTIKDHTGAVIPAASLASLTLMLYKKSDGTILNGRNGLSVLNVNGGTVTSAGLFTMVLTPADNALSLTASTSEVHVALLVWTYNGGASTGRALIEFTISNFLKVP